MKKKIRNSIKEVYNKLKSFEIKRDYYEIEEILKCEDFKPINNKRPDKIRIITFVIPNMNAYAGGHTSILRLGTELSNVGYEIYYVTYGKQSVQEMSHNAKINLKNYKGTFLEKDSIVSLKTDIVIATNWKSVYVAKRIEGYKMYFIQDYEPYFYNYGDYYLLAERTYLMGFDMVSLGGWNKKTVREQVGAEIHNTVDFPYEASEYSNIDRCFEEYQKKNTFKIAVYIKNEAKRLPIIMQQLLENLSTCFRNDGKELVINYFGADDSLPIINGNNLGKLNKEQLNELYRNSDFGFVASLTNISLVPYEMIATGLPIIEFKEGSFLDFFPVESAIITSFDAYELYNQIMEYCNHPDKLYNMQKNAINYIQQFSWKKTCEQFIEIIQKIGIER